MLRVSDFALLFAALLASVPLATAQDFRGGIRAPSPTPPAACCRASP